MSIQCLSNGSSPKLQSKTIIPNDYKTSYFPSDNYDGFDSFTVEGYPNAISSKYNSVSTISEEILSNGYRFWGTFPIYVPSKLGPYYTFIFYFACTDSTAHLTIEAEFARLYFNNFSINTNSYFSIQDNSSH